MIRTYKRLAQSIVFNRIPRRRFANMPFSVSSVLASELEKVHRFYLSIVLDEPLERFVFPNGASDITVKTFADQDRKSMHDPKSTSRPVVVKDSETGELISYALWMFFTENKEMENEETGWLGGEWPSDVNKEPLDALVEEGKKKREDLMKGKPYACMCDYPQDGRLFGNCSWTCFHNPIYATIPFL